LSRFFSSSVFSIATCAFLLAVSGPSATAEPLTPEQIENIEHELSRLEEVLEEQRLSSRSSALSAFQKASSSEKAAYEFYVNCVKKLEFDRKDARFSEFRKWRDRNEDRLRKDGNLAALRLQLKYLVLTLRAAEQVPLEILIPELERFVGNIVANTELLEEGMKLLRQPVHKTPFAELYELDQTLNMDDWCFQPGDFIAVYTKSILPYYRRMEPEGLPAAWERRIQLETDYVETVRAENPVALERYRTETLPDGSPWERISSRTVSSSREPWRWSISCGTIRITRKRRNGWRNFASCWENRCGNPPPRDHLRRLARAEPGIARPAGILSLGQLFLQPADAASPGSVPSVKASN